MMFVRLPRQAFSSTGGAVATTGVETCSVGVSVASSSASRNGLTSPVSFGGGGGAGSSVTDGSAGTVCGCGDNGAETTTAADGGVMGAAEMMEILGVGLAGAWRRREKLRENLRTLPKDSPIAAIFELTTLEALLCL